MYLFDTDVLSNIVKRNPSKTLLQKIQKLPKELQFTSSINIGEIYYGANRSSRKEQILEGELETGKTIASHRGKDQLPHHAQQRDFERIQDKAAKGDRIPGIHIVAKDKRVWNELRRVSKDLGAVL